MEEITLTAKTFRECRLLTELLDQYIKHGGDKVKVIKRADKYIYEFPNVLKINFVPLWQVTESLRKERGISSSDEYSSSTGYGGWGHDE